MVVTLSSVEDAVKKVDISQLQKRAVGQLEVEKLNETDLGKIVYMAVHCCVNGPVGTGKATTWPGNPELDNKSIKNYVTCTNSQWKGFCTQIAKMLPSDSVKSAYTVVKFGQLWPFCDQTFTPKKKD